MISKKLKQRVLEEVTLLKQHATTKEIKRLQVAYIEPSSNTSCIYGQMTGDCYSERAHELLSICAVWPYSITIDGFVKTQMGVAKWMQFRRVTFEGFSPLEYYIYNRQEKISILVDFLKEKGELTIEDL